MKELKISESDLRDAIGKAAKHWAGQSAAFRDMDDLIIWLAKRKAHVVIHPTGGWSKARFSEWGHAQKLARGLNALRRAINGHPSRQWLAVWAEKDRR